MSATRSRRGAAAPAFPAMADLRALVGQQHPDAALLAACARLEDYRDRFDQVKGLRGRRRKEHLATWTYERVKALEEEVGRIPARTAAGIVAKGEAALRDFYEGGQFFILTKAVLQEMLEGFRTIEPLREMPEGEA